MNIILKASRWLYGTMLAGSLAFVASGFVLLFLSPSKKQSGTRQHLSAWGGIIFFGGAALVFGWHVLDTHPRIVIADKPQA